MVLEGEMRMVPLEVALMLKLQPAAEGTSTAVALLDWYDLDLELILVLERPVPCMDLIDYINSRGYHLPEHEAKTIAKQLVDALIEVHSRGVFHRDIKLDNILIETGSDVPRVRLIDFDFGRLVRGDVQYTGQFPFSGKEEISFEDPDVSGYFSSDKAALRCCLSLTMRAHAAASMPQPTSVPVASSVPQLTPVLAAASGSQPTAAEGTSTAVALLDWYDICLTPTSSHGTHAVICSAFVSDLRIHTSSTLFNK
ncbi:serine/threonine-protein kinase pim-2-like [Pseudoliparis swirei]|uniref:serine/threonine-protein kinase pim-2-like n=1 Tax=Pseudoliparis swirei TaxID=2059687 RepID=UPI0024BF0EB3|nr:serine/threonine-protein kinase pim-2-like [Pseudoliparis swirei]